MAKGGVMKICKDCVHVIEWGYENDMGYHVVRTCRKYKAKTKINPVTGKKEKKDNDSCYLLNYEWTEEQIEARKKMGMVKRYFMEEKGRNWYKYCDKINKNGKCKDWEKK